MLQIFTKRTCKQKFTTNVRPTSEIPSVNLIRLLLDLILKRTEHDKKSIMDISGLLAKYGTFFNVNIFGNKHYFTTNPEIALKMFRNEGKYPYREPFPALKYYVHNKQKCLSVVTSSGTDWYRLRKSFEPLFCKSNTSRYLNVNREFADKYTEQIKNQRNEQDVIQDVFQFSREKGLQMGVYLFFGVHIHDPVLLKQVLDGSMKFLNGTCETTMSAPIWNFYKTKTYRNFESGIDTIVDFAESLLSELEKNKCKNFDPLVQLMLADKHLSRREIRLFSAECLCQMIEACPLTVSMVLYYLSRDLERQKKARNSSDYVKLCIKECMRMAHYAGEFSRKQHNDVVMDNYHVPAMSQITYFSPATSVMEEYFNDAKNFIPERWIRSDNGRCPKKHEYSHLATLPFGLGKRICLGRYITYQYTSSILEKVLKKYLLECCNTSEVHMERFTIRKPQQNIQIKFTEIY